jgi:F0F1-type ATP synthase assembly protein I
MARDRGDYRRLALYSSLIFAMPATLLGGLYLGYLADEYFGTRPWLMIAGLGFGIAGAFIQLFRIVGRDSGAR